MTFTSFRYAVRDVGGEKVREWCERQRPLLLFPVAANKMLQSDLSYVRTCVRKHTHTHTQRAGRLPDRLSRALLWRLSRPQDEWADLRRKRGKNKSLAFKSQRFVSRELQDGRVQCVINTCSCFSLSPCVCLLNDVHMQTNRFSKCMYVT